MHSTYAKAVRDDALMRTHLGRMNLAQIVRAIASLVLVAAAAGCVESQSVTREPRSSVLAVPYVDSSRSGTGYAPKYAGAPPRIERMRQ
jgi:hypothetical protein